MRPSDDTAVTGTTAPVVAEGYGPKTDGYGQGYGNQTTGVVRSGTVPEIDSGAGRTGGGNYVQHDPAPYAEVHHGGYAHANPESKTYGRDV